MGDQRIAIADVEQEYRAVFFARRAGPSRTRHPGDGAQSNRGSRNRGDAFLQTSEMSMYPEEFRYTKEHEWVKPEAGIGTIGITDHAQNELGDIVYVDLPKIGTKLEKGKSLGSVESVKAVSDIYSPASGEVTEINEFLTTAPEKLNADPPRADCP